MIDWDKVQYYAAWSALALVALSFIWNLSSFLWRKPDRKD